MTVPVFLSMCQVSNWPFTAAAGAGRQCCKERMNELEDRNAAEVNLFGSPACNVCCSWIQECLHTGTEQGNTMWVACA